MSSSQVSLNSRGEEKKSKIFKWPIRLPQHAPGRRYAWVYRCAEVRASTWAVQNARTSGAVSARDGPALLSEGARARSTSGLLLHVLWVWSYSAQLPPHSRRTLCQGGFGESRSPTGRKCGKTFGGKKEPDVLTSNSNGASSLQGQARAAASPLALRCQRPLCGTHAPHTHTSNCYQYDYSIYT